MKRDQPVQKGFILKIKAEVLFAGESPSNMESVTEVLSVMYKSLTSRLEKYWLIFFY